MKIKNKVIITVILFLGIIIFSNNHCFADNEIPTDTFTDEQMATVNSFIETYNTNNYDGCIIFKSDSDYFIYLFPTDKAFPYYALYNVNGNIYNIGFYCWSDFSYSYIYLNSNLTFKSQGTGNFSTSGYNYRCSRLYDTRRVITLYYCNTNLYFSSSAPDKRSNTPFLDEFTLYYDGRL